MLWVLGNAFAKWHHQLRVRGMILHSVMLWKTTSEPDTCVQESKGIVVSFPSAKSQFGKWLKKPFFTLMSQRLIDLMRTRLFYERNFIGQLASMEEMERYVFLWPWSTTGSIEESLLPFQQHEYSKLLFLSLRKEIQIFERFVVAELRAERADWVLSRFSV